jgi:hypothetical protein
MKQHMSLIASLLILVLCVSACAGQPARGTATATPTEPQPTGSQRTVTLDNDGQTIALQAGETFLLKLGEDYDWTVTLSDETVVSRVVNILVVRGAQGVYAAHKAGTTTLTASGDPTCRQAQPPCERPSRMFSLQIDVQ